MLSGYLTLLILSCLFRYHLLILATIALGDDQASCFPVPVFCCLSGLSASLHQPCSYISPACIRRHRWNCGLFCHLPVSMWPASAAICGILHTGVIRHEHSSCHPWEEAVRSQHALTPSWLLSYPSSFKCEGLSLTVVVFQIFHLHCSWFKVL